MVGLASDEGGDIIIGGPMYHLNNAHLNTLYINVYNGMTI